MASDSQQGNELEPQELNLQALLGRAGLEVYPTEVATKVETTLTAGQALEPTTRLKLVDAARRGTSYVAGSRAPLEVILFKRRRELGVQIPHLEVQAEMTRDEILSIERGDRAITSTSPQKLASWSLELELSSSDIELGLRKSLAPPSPVGSYSEIADLRLSPEHEAFVADVLQAFSVLTDAGSH